MNRVCPNQARTVARFLDNMSAGARERQRLLQFVFEKHGFNSAFLSKEICRPMAENGARFFVLTWRVCSCVMVSVSRQSSNLVFNYSLGQKSWRMAKKTSNVALS